MGKKTRTRAAAIRTTRSAAAPANPTRWLSRGELIALLLILLAGALLRGAYFAELKNAPDYGSPLADSLFHDYWAHALVTGNWTPPPQTDDPHIAEAPYVRPPGYTWFLATVYATFGGDDVWPRIAQMMLGLMSATLAFVLGRTLFSSRVGLILAAVLSCYWIFIYYEGQLQEPALLTALILGLAVLLCRWRFRETALLAIAAGLIAGAFALTRPNILLVLPFAALWMLWCGWRAGQTRRAFAHAVAFAVATCVMIAPATIRNYRVTHEFTLISCNGPLNFFIGNNAESDGTSFNMGALREVTGLPTWSWFSYDRIVHSLETQTGHAVSYADASRFFTDRAWTYIREHPMRFIGLCARRAMLFWAPAEIPNNTVERLERSHSDVLRWLPGYPLMISLTLVGLAMLVRRRKAAVHTSQHDATDAAARRDCLILLAVFIAIYFVSFVPFLAAARFRAPLLPQVFVFAAFALDRLIAMAKLRDFRGVALASAGAATLCVGLTWIASASANDRRDVPWWHTDRGVALANRNQHERAIEEFHAAIQANPQFVDAYVNLVHSELARGRLNDAMEIARQLNSQRPDRGDLQRDFALQFAQRGQELLGSGNPKLAVDALNASLSIDPAQPKTLVNLGVALAQSGQSAAAIEKYRAALAIDANLTEAWYNLAFEFHQRSQLDPAADAYHRVLQLDPRNVDAMVNLGGIEVQHGHFDEATRLFLSALKIDPSNAPARQALQQLQQARAIHNP